MMPPFSPASERNAEPILARLKPLFADCAEVLEIGSGTGQHAVAFAPAMPQLIWHTSDLPQNHPGILAWLAARPAPNLRRPVVLDVTDRPWPAQQGIDAVFSANTAHIMSWLAVCAMFSGVAALLPAGGLFCLYGPFNINGRFTSASNREFHSSLRGRWRHMGIRDRKDLAGLAAHRGLSLTRDWEMPSNNRLLVFARNAGRGQSKSWS